MRTHLDINHSSMFYICLLILPVSSHMSALQRNLPWSPFPSVSTTPRPVLAITSSCFTSIIVTFYSIWNQRVHLFDLWCVLYGFPIGLYISEGGLFVCILSTKNSSWNIVVVQKIFVQWISSYLGMFPNYIPVIDIYLLLDWGVRS